MQQTTVEAIKAILRADPTVTPSERVAMIALLKDHGRAGGAASVGVQPVKRILHRAEVAQRLGYTTRMVDLLTRQGVIQKVRLPGRKRACGFLAEDIDRLLESNRVASP